MLKTAKYILLLLGAYLIPVSNGSQLFRYPLSDWEAYKIEYKKNYPDPNEDLKRRILYENNRHYVEDFNSKGNHSYTLGVNHFSDMTDHEIGGHFNGLGAFFIPR